MFELVLAYTLKLRTVQFKRQIIVLRLTCITLTPVKLVIV